MRTKAREVVFKCLYSEIFNGESDFLLKELSIEEKLSETDFEFASKLLSDVKKDIDSLNGAIDRLSIGFSLKRIMNTDKCAIYIGMEELKNSDIDTPIIINEAVNLSNKFSTEKSPDFVNGILAKFAKEIR